MASDYLNLLTNIFSRYSLEKSKVVFDPPIIFSCGGEIDVRSPTPLSVRHRYHEYCAIKSSRLSSYLIEAESFKTYLESGEYQDLLVFEKDIASISTLILIFLESPGSIAELGLFCTVKGISNKLVIIAPHEEVKNKDSFIYLGPLKFLKNKSSDSSSSVFIYPWAKDQAKTYNQLPNIHQDIEQKLTKANKSETFNQNMSGHVAFLIFQFIAIAYPIRESEILRLLCEFNIPNYRKYSRLLYLLQELGLVKSHIYSSTTFYFTDDNNERFKFIAQRGDKIFQKSEAQMKLRAFLLHTQDKFEEKRRSFLQFIMDNTSNA